jgi:hypothetical protein
VGTVRNREGGRGRQARRQVGDMTKHIESFLTELVWTEG